MAARRRIGEFELIAKYFAPLARDFPGARELKSDNAFLPADPYHDLVVKTDTIVAGVHFPADERGDLVGQRALAVCLSDLAAGGATPFAYQLSLALPPDWTEYWVRILARQLRAMQKRYGIVLCGGDTTRTPGPATITITAFGKVPKGKGIGRDGAQPGDELWVSGTIGDAALGLLVTQGKLEDSGRLSKRYRLPLPQTFLGKRLIGIVNAAADVSDGLLADAGHIAESSKLALYVERENVPLSPGANRAVASSAELWTTVLAGGDDYELVMAVPPRKAKALQEAAQDVGVKVTRIGTFAKGRGIVLTVSGHAQRAAQTGYTHF
jgi:thiamine-monophosphate kinase